jgi:hypothetical protein
MYPLIRSLALVAATGLASAGASAQACPGVLLTRVLVLTGPNGLIAGNTLCAASGGDRWQEQHLDGGQLWDYKLGPNSTTDPRAQVGTWTATNGLDSLLTHTYGGSSYSWVVCRVGGLNSNNYTLVSTSGSATITGATVKTGQASCP